MAYCYEEHPRILLLDRTIMTIDSPVQPQYLYNDSHLLCRPIYIPLELLGFWVDLSLSQ